MFCIILRLARLWLLVCAVITSSFPASLATVTGQACTQQHLIPAEFPHRAEQCQDPCNSRVFTNPLPCLSKHQATLGIKNHRRELTFGCSSTGVFSLQDYSCTQTHFQVARIIWSHFKGHWLHWLRAERKPSPSWTLPHKFKSITYLCDYFIMENFFLSNGVLCVCVCVSF